MIAIINAAKALISMMGIREALHFLQSLPAFFRILGEIYKLIVEVKGSLARKERTKEVHDALKSARETGNTDKIERLFVS